jgi:hypothetical protein
MAVGVDELRGRKGDVSQLGDGMMRWNGGGEGRNEGAYVLGEV